MTMNHDARLAKLEKAWNMREDVMAAAAEELKVRDFRRLLERIELNSHHLARDVEDLHPDTFLASIAISLKRIADRLNR